MGPTWLVAWLINLLVAWVKKVGPTRLFAMILSGPHICIEFPMQKIIVHEKNIQAQFYNSPRTNLVPVPIWYQPIGNQECFTLHIETQ